LNLHTEPSLEAIEILILLYDNNLNAKKIFYLSKADKPMDILQFNSTSIWI